MEDFKTLGKPPPEYCLPIYNDLLRRLDAQSPLAATLSAKLPSGSKLPRKPEREAGT